MSHKCPGESLTWAHNSDESEPDLWCPCSLVSLIGVTARRRTRELRVITPRSDAATAWKWAGASGPFKIGLGAERAGLHTRCNESPAIMRAKSVAGKRLSDQTTGVGSLQDDQVNEVRTHARALTLRVRPEGSRTRTATLRLISSSSVTAWVRAARSVSRASRQVRIEAT